MLTLLAAFAAEAQYRPQYTQYVLNNYLINPAVTGIENYIDVRMGYRQQWAGIEGAPQTGYLSFHLPLGLSKLKGQWQDGLEDLTPGSFSDDKGFGRGRMKARHGLGGMLLYDRIGPFDRSEAYVSYAYHLPLNNQFTLSFGAMAGVVQSRFDATRAQLLDPGDPLDGSIQEQVFSPDLSMGFWLYSTNFYFGASGQQLLSHNGVLTGTATRPVLATSQVHYFGTLGYRLRLGNGLQLVPSLLVKSLQPAPVAVDVNLTAILHERIWVAMSHRVGDGTAAMLRLALSQGLDVAYTYEHRTSEVRYFNTGTHEITLGLRLNNRFGIVCPEFLW